MRKALFTLVFFSISMLAVAQPGSILNLNVFGNSYFTVQLDQQFFQVPDRFYSIRDVAPGSHFLRVYRLTNRMYGSVAKEVFSGYIQIPANSNMNATIERYGRLNITSLQPLFTNYSSYQYAPVHSNFPMAMSASDFTQLKNLIRSKHFDSTRQEIAQQALRQNYLNSGQVSELISLMTFESTKLDLAKFAYSKTIDKQNYHLTYSAFSFESSINELIQFMHNHG